MPVTFVVADHAASEVPLSRSSIDNHTRRIFVGACEAQAKRCRRMLQSSLDEPGIKKDLPQIMPRSNGFVHAVLEAYGSHHHLRIRPDDVWLAILTQFSFYVNAHAEELRQYFVEHDGKKELMVDLGRNNDYAVVANAFADKIGENVTDKTLVEWILPDFTTTTARDRTICSIVMMSTLKAYFEFYCGITCGIPSVTLEGEKSDWERILVRLNRLYELGDQPSVWAEMLRPILRRFVSAFDGAPDRTFWSHVACRSDEMCGPEELSGWITAFCVWSPKGEWKPRKMPSVIPSAPPVDVSSPPPAVSAPSKEYTASKTPAVGAGRVGKGLARRLSSVLALSRRTRSSSSTSQKLPLFENGTTEKTPDAGSPSAEGGSVMARGTYGGHAYTLDGVEYFIMDPDNVPLGYGEVNVTILDDNLEIPCMMVAGHVALKASASVNKGKLDTVSPSPQWFMYQLS